MFDLPFLDLPPLQTAGGTVRLPGSKSISNRALLLAGLAGGTTLLHDPLDSDDTRVMIDALRAIGCTVEPRPGGALAVTGLAGRLRTQAGRLHLGNAGTAMRPLAAALAVLSALQGGRFELAGVPRMHERPIGDLVDALRQLGCAVEYLGAPGYPPLAVRGAPGGVLNIGGAIRVRGDVSSQFLTALLLALPLASTTGDVEVAVDGELISKPYVDITLNLLARFGVQVRREGYARFTIPAGSGYRSPGEFHVEADASSASYFIAAGAIAAAREPVRIEGVGLDSIQGDIAFVDAARAMGASVVGGPGWLEVRRDAWPLRPIVLDCTAIPDAAMTLAVMALYAAGTTRLDGIASWRVKETDRIAAMAAELGRLGATVVSGDDFIEVTAPADARWPSAAVRTYDDHRMAMCLSLANFAPIRRTVRILDPKCVAKTFPDYFEALFGLVRADARDVPVITIDGPTASGKGTLAAAVAARLGFHMLDSGALYRAVALAALRRDIDPCDERALASLAAALDIRFESGRVFVDGAEATTALREEKVGSFASRVSAFRTVRAALDARQLSFRCLPGLVADGRDMGTVVFPDAPLKVYLTASAAMRAERRYKQLIAKGFSANLAALRADLEARDERDQTRSVAPLKPAEDAQLLDNSGLSVDESVEWVLERWEARRPMR